MIRAIALDDEPLALKIIEAFAEKTEGLILEKTFTKQSDAQKYINKFPVDLIFLDIEMPAKNGLDFYKNLNSGIKVIFTTAYAEFAVDAFTVNAVDYLLKPFSYDRFEAAVRKVGRKPAEEIRHISIRADYKLHRINFNQIRFVEGLDDYIKIHLADGRTITARSSMKNISEKLPGTEFIRVHRSFIVPVKDIKSIVNRNIQIDDIIIPVGDTYREDVMKLIRH